MDNNPDAIFKYNPIRASQSLSRETIAVGSELINSYERITCEDFFIIDFVRQDIVHVSSGLRRFLHGWGIMADEGNHNLFNEYVSLFPLQDFLCYSRGVSLFFKLYYTLSLSDRKDITLALNHNLILKGYRMLVFERMTPLLCNSDGFLWLAICSITGSAEENAISAQIMKGRGYDTEVYSEDLDVWERAISVPLTEQEYMTLFLLQQGLTMERQAKEMKVSKDSIKKYRRNVIKKLKVANIAQALSKAYNLGII